jgi:hypothetical protein
MLLLNQHYVNARAPTASLSSPALQIDCQQHGIAVGVRQFLQEACAAAASQDLQEKQCTSAAAATCESKPCPQKHPERQLSIQYRMYWQACSNLLQHKLQAEKKK